MKKLILSFVSFALISAGAHANTHTFNPYVGFDVGLDIMDYTTKTGMDDIYYSGVINVGARIGQNFGAELFFSHSSSTELEFVYAYESLIHEVYFMSYGFDIFGYYSVSNDFDFFTSFGVANYKTYIETDYISPSLSTSDKVSENNVTTSIGIGLMYTFPTDNISILAQYKYIPINNELFGTISEFSAGIRMNF